MAEHSPLPWVVIDEGWNIQVAEDRFIHCEGRTDIEAFANSAFIVRAVNCHHELLAAAKLTELHFKRNHASDNFQCDDEHEAWSALRAAIAKAEG